MSLDITDSEYVYAAYLGSYATVLSGGLVAPKVVADLASTKLKEKTRMYAVIGVALGVSDAKSARAPLSFPTLLVRIKGHVSGDDTD